MDDSLAEDELAMTADEFNLKAGNLQFYDDDRPSLSAGSYEIYVEQKLPNDQTDHYTTTAQQALHVAGPQFTIPAADVYSVFPAADANGDFGRVLPCIVLRNPTLPWERTLGAGHTQPWVALLVFGSDEMVNNPATQSPLVTSTVEELLRPSPHILKPAIDANALPVPLLQSPVKSIVVSPRVFSAIVPRDRELASLVHVRRVSPEDQEVSADGGDSLWSVVIANRFPRSAATASAPGEVNHVHLVSLEGFASYLGDAPQWPEGITHLQLVSLASFRFVSAAQPGQTFAELAQSLVPQTAGDTALPLLRIPVNDAGATAAPRLSHGYVPLSYHTMPGPDTFAWYRGPLTPVVPQPTPQGLASCQHAAASMIYDAAYGVFDHSYAAAFTLGRLLALANPGLSASVQGVQRRMLRTAARLLQRSQLPHLAGVLDLGSLAAPCPTRKAFLGQVHNGLEASLAQLLARAPAVRRTEGTPHPRTPAGSPAERMRRFLQEPAVVEFLLADVEAETDTTTDWLANLRLLYEVPFNHLVPDQRMLPAESLRFFHVDPAWLDVLSAGALSVGVNSSKELAVAALLAGSLRQKAREKVPHVRQKRLRRTGAATAGPADATAGFILRSALVSGWPGLSLAATANGQPVNILRMDRVAPSILLVLLDSVPDTVALSAPRQALAFGVASNWTLPLRSLSAASLGAPLNQNFPAAQDCTQYTREPLASTGGRVLNLVPPTAGAANYLLPALKTALGRANDLGPSEFAIQMVRAPEQLQFRASP